MTIRSISAQARATLRRKGIGVPELTVEVLLCHLLGCTKSHLFAHPEQVLTDDQAARFDALINERLAGKPTQYITGVQEFYGRDFGVTPDVMIPRPETEFVVETVRSVAPCARRIADAGTGSGAIAVTLQLESGAATVATDISLPALRVAHSNAESLGAAVDFVRCDLTTALAPRSVDVVASNPPYVPQTDEPSLQREVRDYEPHVALFGGASGLDNYRRLIDESPRVLRPGGWLVVELGIRQLSPVQDMLGASWTDRRVVDDLAGLPRVLAARYSR